MRCRAVNAWVQYAWLRRYKPMFRWHQVKAWCWRGKIVSVNVGQKFTRVRGTFFRRGWEGHGRFVGRRHDTHVSMRQGHIEWCPIIVACVRQYAPHVTVWANTGGTFGVRRG